MDTSAVGAAIGAIAGEGSGAGIGAAAGAVAGTAGVLLTRGHASVVYPESLLTFRIEAPVSFSTERSSQAFRYVDPSDYDRSFQADSHPPSRAPTGRVWSRTGVRRRPRLLITAQLPMALLTSTAPHTRITTARDFRSLLDRVSPMVRGSTAVEVITAVSAAKEGLFLRHSPDKEELCEAYLLC